MLAGVALTGSFAWKPKKFLFKVFPDVAYAVRHLQLSDLVAAELVADAMRALRASPTLRKGRTPDEADSVVRAAILASYKKQNSETEEAAKTKAVDQLREVLTRATRMKDGEYAMETSSAGKDLGKGATALLTAMFDWRAVFSDAKLRSAKKRSATSDGCAVNLTLQKKEESGDGAKKGKKGDEDADDAEDTQYVEGMFVGGADFGRQGEAQEGLLRDRLTHARTQRGGGRVHVAVRAAAVRERGAATPQAGRRGAWPWRTRNTHTHSRAPTDRTRRTMRTTTTSTTSRTTTKRSFRYAPALAACG